VTSIENMIFSDEGVRKIDLQRGLDSLSEGG